MTLYYQTYILIYYYYLYLSTTTFSLSFSILIPKKEGDFFSLFFLFLFSLCVKSNFAGESSKELSLFDSFSLLFLPFICFSSGQLHIYPPFLSFHLFLSSIFSAMTTSLTAFVDERLSNDLNDLIIPDKVIKLPQFLIFCIIVEFSGFQLFLISGLLIN